MQDITTLLETVSSPIEDLTEGQYLNKIGILTDEQVLEQLNSAPDDESAFISALKSAFSGIHTDQYYEVETGSLLQKHYAQLTQTIQKRFQAYQHRFDQAVKRIEDSLPQADNVDADDVKIIIDECQTILSDLKIEDYPAFFKDAFDGVICSQSDAITHFTPNVLLQEFHLRIAINLTDPFNDSHTTSITLCDVMQCIKDNRPTNEIDPEEFTEPFGDNRFERIKNSPGYQKRKGDFEQFVVMEEKRREEQQVNQTLAIKKAVLGELLHNAVPNSPIKKQSSHSPAKLKMAARRITNSPAATPVQKKAPIRREVPCVDTSSLVDTQSEEETVDTSISSVSSPKEEKRHQNLADSIEAVISNIAAKLLALKKSQQNNGYSTTMSHYYQQLLSLRVDYKDTEKLNDVDQLLRLFDPVTTLLKTINEAPENKRHEAIADARLIVQGFYQQSQSLLKNNKALAASITLALLMGSLGAALGLGACAFITPSMLATLPAALTTSYAGVQAITALTCFMLTTLCGAITIQQCRNRFFAPHCALSAVKAQTDQHINQYAATANT